MIRIVLASLVLFSMLLLASMYLNVPSSSAADVCYSNSVDVVLVIDRSGSMRGTRIEDAKAAAKRFLTVIQQNDTQRLTRVGIVSYASTSSIDQSLTDNFYLLNNAIDDISDGGSTCIQCGIANANKAFDEKGRAGIPKIIILLTDGEANQTIDGVDPSLSFSEKTTLGEQATLDELSNSPAGTTVYTIGLGSSTGESFLQLIASTTNGTYYNSPTSSELAGIYESLATEILPSGLITGVLFEDVNANGIYDYPPDNRLPFWQLELSDSTGTTTVTSNIDGVYTTNLLCDGDYTLTLVPRGGYIQTVPIGGNISVTVSGSELTYNFGVIKDIKPFWIQGIGGDMRINQKLNSNLPKDEYLSIESGDPEMTHGVVFGTGGLVLGGNKSNLSNESGWYVADAAYSFPVVTTNYANMYTILQRGGALSSTKPLFGSACPNTNPNCTLVQNLESGVYVSDTSVTINNLSTYTFPSGKDFIFLINGDLRIDSNLIVPKDSTVMFIVKRKIIIDPSVTRLQGIFSAGDEFRIDGCNCEDGDEQLIIEGSVIANSDMVPDSISFTNRRDLKFDNEDTPSVLIKYRPDFALNAPDLFRYKSYTIKEVAPGS